MCIFTQLNFKILFHVDPGSRIYNALEIPPFILTGDEVIIISHKISILKNRGKIYKIKTNNIIKKNEIKKN